MVERTSRNPPAVISPGHRFLAVLLALPLAGAATAALAQPGEIVTPTEQPSSPQVREAISDRTNSELRGFYAARANKPLWISDGLVSPAAQSLYQRLTSARLDGVDPGILHLADLDKTMARARDGSPEGLAKAELALSRSFALYVKAMRAAPHADMVYESEALKPVVPTTFAALEDAAAAPDLAAYVTAMGWMHPLYAPLRDALASDTLTQDQRRAVEINLERVRALPAMPADRYVLVDAAGARLWMYQNGRPVDTMRVVVGKPDNPTPMMAGFIRYAILNPYWNVPPDLVQKSIAEKVLTHGIGALSAEGYQVMSGWSDDAHVVDPATIDWSAVAHGAEPPRVRQLPGRDNFMGKVKYEFPNPLGIYLHDTPAKGLLRKDQRTFSSGCVRLEDAPRLGRWLLKAPLPTGVTKPEQQIDLPEIVPVYITYLTAAPDNGQIAFRTDVYDRDRAEFAAGPGRPLAAR